MSNNYRCSTINDNKERNSYKEKEENEFKSLRKTTTLLHRGSYKNTRDKALQDNNKFIYELFSRLGGNL